MEEIVEDALRIYRSELSGRLRRLREALELGNAKAVEAEAHALRSASLNVWAGALAGCLGQVENAAVEGDIDAARALMAPVMSEFGRVVAYLDLQLPQGS